MFSSMANGSLTVDRHKKANIRIAAALCVACVLGLGVAARATTTVVNYAADGPSSMAYAGINSQTYWEFGGSLDNSAKFVDLGNSGFSSATGGVPSPAQYNIKNEKVWVYVLNQEGNGNASTDPVQGGALTQIDSDQQYLAGLISIGTPGPSPLPGVPYPSTPTSNVRAYGRSLTPRQGYSYKRSTTHTGTVTTTIPTAPVPEPAALALLGLGAMGVLLTRRSLAGAKK